MRTPRLLSVFMDLESVHCERKLVCRKILVLACYKPQHPPLISVLAIETSSSSFVSRGRVVTQQPVAAAGGCSQAEGDQAGRHGICTGGRR